VIAKTSSGRRFGPLADYLVHGRSGVETDRVAWTASRNLGTDEPELAGASSQGTMNNVLLGGDSLGRGQRGGFAGERL